MRQAHIIGAYSTRFKKWPDRSFKNLGREACLGALTDAEMDRGEDIGFVHFSTSGMHHWGQFAIPGQVCLIPLVQEGLLPERVPIVNVEGACASGSLAFNGAFKEILSGQSELALAVGVEKVFWPDDPARTFAMYEGGTDTFDPQEFLTTYRETARACGRTFEPAPGRTVFMDTYAIQACYHMWRYGTTQGQLALAASKNHDNGSLNPKAQYRFKVSVEEVLADRLVSYPFTRSMCSPVGDGAAAVLLCSDEYLEGLSPKVRGRAVRVAASALASGKYRLPDEQGLSHVAAQRAYDAAGVGPEDIDVAEVHDATSFCEIYQAEMLGFCPVGEGGRFIESGATTREGKIPINTSGGLVSKGHPIGATGLSMIYELAAQLRGEVGARQVNGAEFALQENGGGVIGLEEAACSVVILHKEK
jgi:acetyl-CoA acetyltransferase